MGLRKKCLCPHFWGIIIVLGLMGAGCETQTSLVKKRIKSIENGLLRAVYLKGQKPEKLRLEDRMVFYRVPGVCLAFIDNDVLSWTKGYGYRDSKEDGPVTAETIFQAGAFSQPIVAALALSLVEEGKLALDRDLNEYLKSWKVSHPEISGSRPITLRDLLLHRAGFSNWVFPGYSRKEPLPSLSQILRGEKPAINTPLMPLDKPGTVIRTSESGYVVLQQLIEDVSGRPLSELARERIFIPARMRNTYLAAELPPEARASAASGSQRDGSLYPEKWRLYPELGAKGLWTTAADMASFIGDLMAAARGDGSKFISPEAARAMLTTQAGSRGFGFIIEGSGDDVYFHWEGRTAGFACALLAFPAKKQGIVVMTNSDNGQILIDEIFRATAAAYNWPHFKPVERPLYRLDPAVYEQYVGRYEISPDYILEVKYEDYYLIIQPTGQAPTKFYVESETVFFSIDPFIRIQFRRDEHGRVTHLILWQQDFEQVAKKIS